MHKACHTETAVFHVQYTRGAVGRRTPHRKSSQLQPQLSLAIFAEQVSVPDIPPYHLNAFVPGLIHDGAFVDLGCVRESECRIIVVTHRLGGYPTIGTRATMRPGLLILVQRRSHEDRQAALFECWIGALRADQVEAEYLFTMTMPGSVTRRDRRYLSCWTRWCRAISGQDGSYLFGDSDGLLEPVTGRLVRSASLEGLVDAVEEFGRRRHRSPHGPAFDAGLPRFSRNPQPIGNQRNFQALPIPRECLVARLTHAGAVWQHC